MSVFLSPAGLRKMTRFKAFGTHFLLSLAIVSFVLTVVLLLWYPQPWFQVFNAVDVIKVLIAVDLVLGPLLTLILFSPGKKGLWLDMSCVFLLQITALVYGVSVIYDERPYFAVFAKDRFEVMPRKDVELEGVDNPAFLEKPWSEPIFVVAQVPTDPKAYNRLLEETLFEGKPDIGRRPEFWFTYADNADMVLAHAKPLENLARIDAQVAEEVAQLQAKHGDGRLAYVPVLGKKDFLALVIDETTTRPVDIIGVDPYLADKLPAQPEATTSVASAEL